MVVSQKVLLRERKNNRRELLFHLVNLREKTQCLSFLSDLGSVRIQLSLLAPRSSLIAARDFPRDVPSNEERGARSEKRGEKACIRSLRSWWIVYTVAGFQCHAIQNRSK